MAVTVGKPVRLDILAFELPFSSNRTPPIDWTIGIDGSVVSRYQTYATSDQVRVSCLPGQGVAIEILDHADAVLSPAFPGRFTLNWVAVANAKSYRVEEYVSAAWTERETVLAHGETAFSWESRWLENIATHQFRVIPLTSAGTEGSALAFSGLMVRHDAVPAVSYAYSSGTTKVTVSAR